LPASRFQHRNQALKDSLVQTNQAQKIIAFSCNKANHPVIIPWFVSAA